MSHMAFWCDLKQDIIYFQLQTGDLAVVRASRVRAGLSHRWSWSCELWMCIYSTCVCPI